MASTFSDRAKPTISSLKLSMLLRALGPLYGDLLRGPWDLAFAWLTEEPTIRHKAMPRTILLAVISVALLWGWAAEAAVFGLTWTGTLEDRRGSECF